MHPQSTLSNVDSNPPLTIVAVIPARYASTRLPGKALADLTFSKKRIAQDVKKALNSAIANAENNHNLDVDRLIVAEASVGKGLVMKRFQTRGRGRAAGIIKPFSHLTIVVRERAEAEDK